jgi:hypothetical protein
MKHERHDLSNGTDAVGELLLIDEGCKAAVRGRPGGG